ncbi:TerC family protein [Ureibacillus manganicus]|uniref:Membrane protein n=1 Tax=Ureibacillus manganicus DSM 26584 TaxID=1384049 RepID=A0A0A3HXA3_9BACL|nr:TerC family protein [Ureibacillus manganicus]KGR74998.1 membrane protein [Ureibacillus manganicus DSM 26584]
MEWLTDEFFVGLITIILIDLVLAGDNALLIGLVAKNLPKSQQKKAIIFGAFTAVFVRIAFTLVAVRLLEIDGLLLVGGVLLLYIAYKILLADQQMNMKPSKNTFFGAIGTIILADLLMGIDNIIAVAGASDGNTLLVIIGLAISIPIVIWGSTFVIILLEKLPIILFVGTGILAYTGAKMITQDPYVDQFFPTTHSVQQFQAIVVITVLLISITVKLYLIRKNRKVVQK